MRLRFTFVTQVARGGSYGRRGAMRSLGWWVVLGVGVLILISEG